MKKLLKINPHLVGFTRLTIMGLAARLRCDLARQTSIARQSKTTPAADFEPAANALRIDEHFLFLELSEFSCVRTPFGRTTLSLRRSSTVRLVSIEA